MAVKPKLLTSSTPQCPNAIAIPSTLELLKLALLVDARIMGVFKVMLGILNVRALIQVWKAILHNSRALFITSRKESTCELMPDPQANEWSQLEASYILSASIYIRFKIYTRAVAFAILSGDAIRNTAFL